MPIPPQSGSSQDARKIYRVAEITKLIRMTLEDTFGGIWIEGEVSNLRRPASGHMYFTLKDEGAQISSVLFRGSQRGMTFELKDGLKVRVFGELSVYDAAGQYQVVVRRVEEAGKGSLQEAFEALKKRLAGEGLFDADRKKRLPVLPRHIGVVTSPTGAAIRDILHVLARRFPNVHVLIAPVRVQGEGAAQEIADAVQVLNRRDDIEVMIVGRGGGSLEDLWCFNEEVVARAIAGSRIPVISAVGHETDFTISDFVSDLRAPTPSAAAEVVVGQKIAFEESLGQTARRLGRALRQGALERRSRLMAASGSYVFREPRNLLRQHVQRLDHLRVKMGHALVDGARDARQAIANASVRMRHVMEMGQRGARQDVQRLQSQLKALSPLAVLDRGFSITKTAGGEIIRDASDVASGETVVSRVARGILESKVTATRAGGKSDGGEAD